MPVEGEESKSKVSAAYKAYQPKARSNNYQAGNNRVKYYYIFINWW